MDGDEFGVAGTQEASLHPPAAHEVARPKSDAGPLAGYVLLAVAAFLFGGWLLSSILGWPGVSLRTDADGATLRPDALKALLAGCLATGGAVWSYVRGVRPRATDRNAWNIFWLALVGCGILAGFLEMVHMGSLATTLVYNGHARDDMTTLLVVSDTAIMVGPIVAYAFASERLGPYPWAVGIAPLAITGIALTLAGGYGLIMAQDLQVAAAARPHVSVREAPGVGMLLTLALIVTIALLMARKGRSSAGRKGS